MLRLRAFRPTQDKVVKLLLHPTYPWLVTADASDNVVVWDWEHRQVCALWSFASLLGDGCSRNRKMMHGWVEAKLGLNAGHRIRFAAKTE